ncbi:MAG TPA: esterase [Gammaproteobacteria bacterium]|nr:esterase [Gammaproteobacteria bacterium]
MPRWAVGAVVVLLVAACAPHQVYRSDYTLCRDARPEQACPRAALQETADSADPAARYLLGFVEFDDQGQLWDRAQMDAVLGRINAEAADKDLLLLVFVHGWKHSAAPGDGNVNTFRGVLGRLAALENRISAAAGLAPRKVVGVYLGWRGGSVTVPVVKELSFWDRKNVAHKVGYGGVTEVLARLELVQKTKDAMAARDASGPAGAKSRTRLVVIGHSFGGAVVFSALSQILEMRFVDTTGPLGVVSDVRGFGDLVVLINPAFEAARYAVLSDMATERGTYFPSQLPVLAVLTSQADYATKLAFPLGRWFSTLFEKEHEASRKNGLTGKRETIDQGRANVTAVGHFAPYQTHRLSATATVGREALAPVAMAEDLKLLFNTVEEWRNDAPGNVIQFHGARLTRSQTSAGRNPYLVVKVDKALIRDHNDMDDPRIIGFIRQLVLLASLARELEAEQVTPAQLLGPE